MYAKKNSSKKMFVALLAIALLIGCTIGGTIAWLMDSTETVTNTFTVGDVNIELKEHDLKSDGTLDTTEVSSEDTYKIVPGTNQPKDPFVTVKAKSEDCYVFVQVQEVNNVAAKDDSDNVTHKYVTWAIDDSVWTKLAENADTGVTTYYATTSYITDTADKTYNVLKDQKVSYGDELTKDMIEKLYTVTDGKVDVGTVDAEKQPKLIFKAFAVQAEAATTAADAWDKIDASAKLPNP